MGHMLPCESVPPGMSDVQQIKNDLKCLYHGRNYGVLYLVIYISMYTLPECLSDHLPDFAGHEVVVEWQIQSELSECLRNLQW